LLESVPIAPLCILSAGVCCALGNDLPSTQAALRARLNHFRETRFVGLGGKPVVGAAVYGSALWGADRQVEMLKRAVTEAWAGAVARADDAADTVTADTTALLLVLPEAEQSAAPLDELHEAFDELVDGLGLHPASRAAQTGAGGIAEALRLAGALLRAQNAQLAPAAGPARPRQVLLACVDSWLSAPRIEQLLAQSRLQQEGQTDALLPGEAAACVLLSLSGPTDRAATWVMSAAHARDPWRLEAELPQRAQALTQVLRAATAQAGLQLADMDFHASGANGEFWYARELEMALSRCMERRREHYPHFALAQFVGDTGASLPVVTLAWADAAMRHPRRCLGQRAMMHFAGTDGQRSAMVLACGPAGRFNAPRTFQPG
jgi:3-oxoacyl-[acyl-carrier-protein] synthase-1